MTEPLHPAAARRVWRLTWPQLDRPLLVTLLNAGLFVVLQPGVPDLQAALARGAAATDGVGLGYWFQWFGGGAIPGQYSIIAPLLSSWVTAPVLGALATVALTPLVDRALIGARHRTAGTWVAVVTAGLSLWSGRIAFALGAALAVAAVVAVRQRRTRPAVLAAVAAACASPVCAAFLAVALGAAWIASRPRDRVAAAAMIASLAALGLIAVSFGTPGPQIFDPITAVLVGSTSLIMLLARPARVVRIVALLTAAAAPVLFTVPNGLGSNLGRMSYICLPVAVVATSAVRRAIAVLVIAPAVAVCGWGSVHDLRVASHPAAYAPYYAQLADELGHVPGLRNHRLEVVQSLSFHTAAWALLDRAALATGWETQEQQAVASVLNSHRLTAAGYHRWLDDNAVGYVAFDRTAHVRGPEYTLVASRPSYLVPVWRGTRWTLFRVRQAQPIVAPPGVLLKATQARLTLRVTHACTVPVRVRWSALLAVVRPDGTPIGTVRETRSGWTTIRVPAAGTYRLAGVG